MQSDPDALQVITIVATLGGVVVPVLFAVQYTWLARWWRSPNGRVIMALDLCIALARVPRIAELVHTHSTGDAFGTMNWYATLASLGIPVVIMWRMVVFERQRRRQARRELQTARLAALGCR